MVQLTKCLMYKWSEQSLFCSINVKIPDVVYSCNRSAGDAKARMPLVPFWPAMLY